MFTSHKQFRRNPKTTFFNDKELPAMGSNNESVVLPVLDCLCSPKAATPHTNIFSMHKKKTFVAGIAVRNTVTQKKSSTIALDTIKQELQSNYPLIKQLRVKRFYNTGRVIARANIGCRHIRVTGSLANITDKFTVEYQDRFPTAFINLNTI